MTPLAWVVLGCAVGFLIVCAVLVFGKERYDNSVAAADATDPADQLYLAQMRDPGNGDDYTPLHPVAQRSRERYLARRQLGIGHLLAQGHNPKTCPECRELSQ